jgi:hypothetical protein
MENVLLALEDWFSAQQFRENTSYRPYIDYERAGLAIKNIYQGNCTYFRLSTACMTT